MSWLLDHPDIHITELSDADTISDEYSDEEVLEELEEAEPIFPVVQYFCFISGNNKPDHLSLSQSNLIHDMINNSLSCENACLLHQPSGAVVTESQTFKKRPDFQSNDDYAVYVRENIQVITKVP